MSAHGRPSDRSSLRYRAVYVAAALGTIVLGLLVYLRGSLLGPVARDVLGDALWAMMIAWWLGALVPHARLVPRSAIAYAVCAAVEFSQLYHTPTLDSIRATPIGHLVLGSGFDVRDLFAYALGVVMAALGEMRAIAVNRRRKAELQNLPHW